MIRTKHTKATYYIIRALYKKKKNGVSNYEWREMRACSTKREAVDYAKEESKYSYRDGRTGRYLIQKQTNECFIEDGKVINK